MLYFFAVYGHPNASFDGIEVVSVAGEGRPVLEGETDKFFMAKGLISKDQSEVELMSGMTGRGKINSDWRPVGFVMFNWIFRFLALEVFF